MSRNWTNEQRDAINAREGSVLVSAAAGSGKTAVLVERVIERLTDKNNPTDADRLLIVTFTRAAAGEMRERIADAIAERLRENPTDENLINQQMLLPSAKICTIDSFCSGVVKEYFQYLDIAPDFKTADEGELSVLRQKAVDETLEKMYVNGGENFRNLVELLFSGRDDRSLGNTIMRLHENSMSFPFPDKWLDSLAKCYEIRTSASESIFGNVICNYVTTAVTYALEVFSSILNDCQGDEDMQKIFLKAVTSDKTQCEYILSRLEEGSWDEARNAIMRFDAVRRGNTPKHLKDDFTVQRNVAARKKMTENIKALSNVMCCSEKEYTEDMEYFYPMIKSLTEATKLFTQIYGEIKKTKKIADFSDIAHMALSLLVKDGDDSWESTPLAEKIREDYDEILIDEYQDTNLAQDMLFSSISRNNLFRVGDVKQSIYSFRQAMPQIFIDLKDSYGLYDRENPAYPAKIVLANNFRSRQGVTDIINFIFGQLMSKRCGDIDYGDEEKLVFSAAYGEKEDADSELHLIDTSEIDKQEKSSDEAQAEYVASLINKMIADGYKVKDKDGERNCSYKDFAVLLRSLSGSRGAVYAQVFREKGIPCFTEISGTFLSSVEISLALNILRIIDNPAQDVPLLGVMMSVLFGFTADEVAQVRINKRKGDIYSCILSGEKTEKTKAFLEKISYWRGLSSCLQVSELIKEIYNDTAIVSVFDAADKSGVKKANLMLLLDYAQSYEKDTFGSLSGFIRFIDRLCEQKQDLSGSLGMSQQADVVKIMSIHKSKGLEFPVCIVGNCAGKFNRMDENENLVISLKHGLGVIRRDIKTFEQYPTVCHNAIKLSMKQDRLSEELRVLYVALTRAREKLIMVWAGDKIADTCIKYSTDINALSDSVNPFCVGEATSFDQWILTCLIRHKDCSYLREQIGMDDSAVLPCSVPLKLVVYKASSDSERLQTDVRTESVDSDFLKLISQRASYRYKYEKLSNIVTKRAASEVDKNFVDRDYFASSMPSFMSEQGLTGAAKGIATHTFIQFADYEKAKADTDGEIERLRLKGLLSDEQAKAIDRGQIKNFFESELARRILSSELVMREKKFTIEVPISEIYPETQDITDEKMMIQGIADCAFLEDGELVVVDYKTDRLDSEELFCEKYSSQVTLYKKALSLCTDYNVKQTLLYSFHLSKQIEVG